jgi:hypothetical protein
MSLLKHKKQQFLQLENINLQKKGETIVLLSICSGKQLW